MKNGVILVRDCARYLTKVPRLTCYKLISNLAPLSRATIRLQFEEIDVKPIYFSNERDILSLVYMKRDCFRHFKGYQEEFEQSLGQVQNLVLQYWGRNCAGLQCRVRVFEDLRNLCLIKNTFVNTAEENMIVPLLIKQMEKRKKEGKIQKSNIKDPGFLKYSRRPKVF